MQSQQSESHHPTAVIHKACSQLLRCLTLCSGIHAEHSQRDAINVLSGLMRTLVDCGCSHGLSSNSAKVLVAREQHQEWCTLGFVRSVATSPLICQALSSPQWLALLLRIVADDYRPDTVPNLSRQVLAMRLLQQILPTWQNVHDTQMKKSLVQQLFGLLGSVLRNCGSDPTLILHGQLLAVLGKKKKMGLLPSGP